VHWKYIAVAAVNKVSADARIKGEARLNVEISRLPNIGPSTIHIICRLLNDAEILPSLAAGQRFWSITLDDIISSSYPKPFTNQEAMR
jgi:hypothetical protein